MAAWALPVKMSLYDTAIDMAKQERGLVAFAQKNTVDFEIEGAVMGLNFYSIGVGVRADAAMLDQVTRQLLEHVRERNDA